MKKLALILTAIILSAGFLSAQDMSEATEKAKAANEALTSGDNAGALAGFKEALTLALACGEDGAELVGTCKGIIPDIVLRMAKEQLKASKYDEALKTLDEAVAVAKEYENNDVLGNAETLVGQALMAKGTDLLKEKKFAEAADAYQKAFERDTTNGTAALRLGQALSSKGDTDAAVAAFEKAAKLGQEENANKQISTMFLKQAVAAIQGKSYAKAVEAATKAAEYSENAQAWQIAGQASQQLGKNADAIKYFEKYLELAPTAKNANTIAFTIGALYQKSGNNTKAKEYYQKVINDPSLGAQAKQLVDSLK